MRITLDIRYSATEVTLDRTDLGIGLVGYVADCIIMLVTRNSAHRKNEWASYSINDIAIVREDSCIWQSSLPIRTIIVYKKIVFLSSNFHNIRYFFK